MRSQATFLDACIFMYAAGAPHPYKDPCVQILTDLEMGRLVAAVNTEIIQEILYRYSHIGLADKGLQLSRDILRYSLTILPVTEEDIRLAMELYDAHRAGGVKPRDVIHAATMQRSGISRILSTDKHFDQLGMVMRIDPLAYITKP